MSSEVNIRVSSEEETEKLGRDLGKLLSGGEVIELISDLGGGKTTLTRGLARGIGSGDTVSSPTFTISNVYQGTELTMHHYDFYRIGELGLMSEELKEVMEDSKVVAVLEWADSARGLLPEARSMHITINLVAEDENARDIHIKFGDELSELGERLT